MIFQIKFPRGANNFNQYLCYIPATSKTDCFETDFIIFIVNKIK